MRWQLIVIASILVSFVSVARGADNTLAPILKPDPHIQKILQNLVPPINSEADFRQNLELLRKVPTAELVRQMLLFSVKSQGMEEAMTPGGVIEQLEISHGQIALALVDYLDTPDPKLHKQIQDWLRGAEAENREGPPNFSYYVGILLQRRMTGESLPAGLIRHMYETDPHEALFSLVKASEINDPAEIKALRWSDHLVKEVLWRKHWGFEIDDKILVAAKSELNTMSQNRQWWVRFYVAQIMQQHPVLRQTEIIKKFQKDENPLVREAAASLVPPQP
ncbi:MAG: hypothetical protein ACYC26_07820 [Phycisphaerales bacterium]